MTGPERPLTPSEKPAPLVRPSILAGAIIAAGAAFWLSVAAFNVLKARAREQRFLSDLKARYAGKIAWAQGKEVKVLDVADLPGDARALTFTFDAPLRRVLFSTRGDLLFALLQDPKSGRATRIVVLDLGSGLQRTILDLASARLEGEEIDAQRLYVVSEGEAEAENDRLVFRPAETESWYSVEAKRERVRPVEGPPPKAWDQSRSPDGRRWLAFRQGEPGSPLVVTDGEQKVAVSSASATVPGAWWCRGR